jgi:membrane fusion protein (multidrug efflux system)
MRYYYLLLLCIVYTALVSCHASGSQKDPAGEPITLPVLKLKGTDTVLPQDYVADIQASRNVEIRAMVHGFISRILVDEGQEVRKGQALFLINDAEFQTALSQASATLSNARAEARSAELELKRVKILVDKNIVARSEYELAQSKLESAEARIAEALSIEQAARIKLSYTHICAPFDGIIDRIPLKQGSLVNEGSLLTTVSDLQSMYAYFSVSENEYLRFKQGPDTATKAISLVLADGSIYPQPGQVETMESEFDKNTGSIAFRARFTNPGKILKHGATGSVRLVSAIPDALIIPQKSVFEIQDKDFVFVLDKNNVVRMQSIVPRKRIDKLLIIQSGLAPDDRIVCEGVQHIREGARITPRYISMDSVLSIEHTD